MDKSNAHIAVKHTNKNASNPNMKLINIILRTAVVGRTGRNIPGEE